MVSLKQLTQPVRDTSHQREHAAQVIVLVMVQKGLELGVEEVQVLLDEHSFTRLVTAAATCLQLW